MKKILNLFLVGALVLGAVSAADFVRPTAAYAAAGCTFNYNNTTVTMTISNISCTSGSSARAWIRYYRSDNDPRVYLQNGPVRSSGSSAATRPSGSFYHSAGYEVFV